ncbi:MAG: DUF6600 domain-containing protein, partial [Thermoanaerobaculia bacterium]
MIAKLRKAALAALFAGLAGGAAASAQNYQNPQDYDDPDSYGSELEVHQTVARVGEVWGDVSFARGDAPDDWQPAGRNIPMTLGDRTWTAGGRLELQVHGGSIVRLGPGTDFAALNLTEDTKQFSLSSGSGFFKIRRLDSYEVFEVDTPNAAITFERPGDYRVDVGRDGDTRVQVRRGRAIIAAGGGQVGLDAGEAMTVDGFDTPRYDIIGLSRFDDWDRWNEERDRRYARVRSYDYVSADISGVHDLDVYGRWSQIPSYGWVWSPRSVASSWAPYRAGRWIWQDPWGWTWVSSEPWGWAPYHYGRWVVHSSRWYWVPVAPRVSVVAYSPALVAFVGGGPGFSVSVGFGSGYVGWFPLAPRDPFLPWWGHRQASVNVNVTNITYVNRTYITVVNETTFVQGRAVAANRVRDRAVVSRISNAPVVRGTIPIVPTRESIRVAPARQTRVARPPAAVATRQVVTRMAPPPAPPRFDSKVAVIRENRGAPIATRQAERIVEQQERTSPRPARALRPVATESGRVTLAPKSEKTDATRAARPEPVAPVRGRPMATSERPVAPQPAPPPRDRESAGRQERVEREKAPGAAPSPPARESRDRVDQKPADPEPDRIGRPTPRPAPERETQQRQEEQQRETAQQQQREAGQREVQQRQLQQQRETAQKEAQQREAEQ